MAQPSTYANMLQTFSLDSILGELGRDSFLKNYLGKRFVALPGPANRFSQLLGWSDLNRLLEAHTFTTETLRMTKEGQEITDFITEYTKFNRPPIMTRISSKLITEHLRQGATLIVNEIQKPVERIRLLAETLETALDARVNVNMYFSLYEKHGFGCHYDMHDVLVLQLHGRKHWQVFGSRSVTPFPHEAFDRTEKPPVIQPIWDEMLTQGDALYLPRGFWHFAKPIGEPTLHLTIGIVRPTGLDVLNWLVQQLAGNELIRADTPLPQHPETHAEYVSHLRAAIAKTVGQPELLGKFMRHRSIAETGFATPWRVKFGLPWSATEAVVPPTDDALIQITTPNGLRPYDSREVQDTIDLYHEGKAILQCRRRVIPLCEYLTCHAPVTVDTFLHHFRAEYGESLLRDFLHQLALNHFIVMKTDQAQVSNQDATAGDAPMVGVLN